MTLQISYMIREVVELARLILNVIIMLFYDIILVRSYKGYINPAIEHTV